MANEDNPFSKFKFGTPDPQQTQRPAAPAAPVNAENPFEGRNLRPDYPKYKTEEGPVGPPSGPTVEPSMAGRARAVASGVMEGLSSVPGQIGDYVTGIGTQPAALGDWGLRAVESARQYMTGKEKPESETYISGVTAAKNYLDKMDRYGKMAKYAFMPSAISTSMGGPSIPFTTTEDITKAVQPYAEKYLGVGPEYQPQTDEEKILKSAGSFGGQAVAGPGKAIPRLLAGTASGVGSEVAGQQTEGTILEGPARFLGAIAGGVTPDVAKTTGKFVFNPESLAKEKLASVIDNYGVESTRPATILGEVDDIVRVQKSIPDRIREFGRRLTGVDHDLPTFQRMLDDEGRASRDRVYGIARENPNAYRIPNELFDDLNNRPIFLRAQENAMEAAANNPEWGIVVPYKGSKGNLNYWDEVKRQLDRMYATEDPNTVKNIKGILTDKLDTHVEGYRQARDVASDTFRASSAPEAGMNFMSNLDALERGEIASAIREYNPQQRKAFNAGVMQSIYDAADKGQISSLAEKMMKNRIFQEKLQTALGNENFSVLRGKILSENLAQKAYENYERSAKKAGRDIPSPYKGGLLASGASLLAFDVPMVQSTLQQLKVNPTATTMFIVSGLLGYGGVKAFNAGERRVVGRMLNLIEREDPRSFRELDELTRKHPNLYNAILAPLAARATMEGVDNEQEQKASGGRVGRATGGRALGMMTAEKLMQAAHRAKKQINQKTEEILDMPDEAVVKALDIAQRHI